MQRTVSMNPVDHARLHQHMKDRISYLEAHVAKLECVLGNYQEMMTSATRLIKGHHDYIQRVTKQ